MSEKLPPPESTYQQKLDSRGTPGSFVAADGRQHVREFPCPVPTSKYAPASYLTQDGHLWLPIWPPLDLQKVSKVLPEYGNFPRGHGGP